MPLTPTLLDTSARDTLIARVQALTPDAPRQWGKMTVQQMLWHCAEAYKVALGDIQAGDKSNWFLRNVVRRVAFHTPMTWPKNGPTLPRFDALKQQPAVDREFITLRETVVALIQRVATSHLDRTVHPAFGPLSQAEWQHWGWRHMDHHLRQFGS
jgi:hypothetical protein